MEQLGHEPVCIWDALTGCSLTPHRSGGPGLSFSKGRMGSAIGRVSVQLWAVTSCLVDVAPVELA